MTYIFDRGSIPIMNSKITQKQQMEVAKEFLSLHVDGIKSLVDPEYVTLYHGANYKQRPLNIYAKLVRGDFGEVVRVSPKTLTVLVKADAYPHTLRESANFNFDVPCIQEGYIICKACDTARLEDSFRMVRGRLASPCKICIAKVDTARHADSLSLKKAQEKL